MSEIVKAARNFGVLPQFVPAPCNVRRVARWVRRNRLAPRKQVVSWQRLTKLSDEPISMRRENGCQIVVDRDHAASSI